MTCLRVSILTAALLVAPGISDLNAAPSRGDQLLSGVPISVDCRATVPPAHPVLGSYPGVDMELFRAERKPELSDAEWLSEELCEQIWRVLSEAGAHSPPADLNLPSRAVLQARMVDTYLDGSRVVDQRIKNNLWPVSVPHWSLEVTWRVRFQVQYGSGVLGPSLDLVLRGSSHQEDYQRLDIGPLLQSATNKALARLPRVLADEGRLGELLFTLRSDKPTPPSSWSADPLLEKSFALLLSVEDEVRHAALAIFLSSPKLPLEDRRDLARWFAINEPSFAIQRDALAWYMQQEATVESGAALRPEAIELLFWLLQRASSHRLRADTLLALKGRDEHAVRSLLLTGAADADPRVANVAISQLHNFKAATASELSDPAPATPPSLPAWSLELDGRLAPGTGSNRRQLLALSGVAGGAAASLWLNRWLAEDEIVEGDRSWLLDAWSELSRTVDPTLRMAVLKRLLRERHFLGVDELITERAELDPDSEVRSLALTNLKDGPRQLNIIISAASGADAALRRAAATALGSQSDSKAEIRLRSMTQDDPNRKVRAAARKALRKRKRAKR